MRKSMEEKMKEERDDTFSLPKRLGITQERAEELGEEMYNQIELVPELTDVLDWILDNHEGKEEKFLLVEYGVMLMKNERNANILQQRQREVLNAFIEQMTQGR